MALPMVHFLAAHAWGKDKPELSDCPEYYLGSIAPDAIHIRDGNDKSHKDDVHLHNWREPHPEEVLRYWETHFTPFDIGYGIHVLLDGQWSKAFRRDFPQLILPDGRANPEYYYNDTLIADFTLFQTCPQSTYFMDMIDRATAPEAHPLLSKREFEQWREATLHFYDKACPKSAPVRFITLAYIHDFLEKCTALMTTTYNQARRISR